MRKYGRVLALALAALAGVGAVVLSRAPAREQGRPPAAGPKDAGKETPEAAVRKTAAAFVAAFNRGDARAVAAFWTENGEYVGPEGNSFRGRAAIEKAYAEFFRKNPKPNLELRIDSIRLLGARSALEEGMLRLRRAGDTESGESRYSVLHVRDEDGWRMALVREWVPDESERNALESIAWLVGEWSAQGKAGKLVTRYAWDESKTFLRCRYTLKQGDKTSSTGMQIIARDPAGGLRSWLFDSSGTYGESAWSRDGNRWLIEARGTLPDGTVMTAVNILVPLGKDSFTWQSVERKAGETPLPDQPPVKVTRIRKAS